MTPRAEGERPAPAPDSLRASVSRLMRGLNHDLKNPLGAAEGYLELLAEGMLGELNEEQRRTVLRTRSLLAGAVAIIDDVVTYARASLGELDTRRVPTDVSSLVRMTLQPMEVAAAERRVSLRTEAPQRMDEALTDPDRLSRIVRHLVSNAIAHAPEGSEVRVTVREEERDDADWIAVEVTDQGPGIPEEELDRLFFAFEKGDDGTAGPGFGLPLSRALAQLLGGQLSVRTAVGEGAAFTLHLPARPA